MPGGKKMWDNHLKENYYANKSTESEDSRKQREFRQSSEIYNYLIESPSSSLHERTYLRGEDIIIDFHIVVPVR